MHYLYGSKPDVARRLVATLLAYVRWATLSGSGEKPRFEQGSALAGHGGWEYSGEPLIDEEEESVVHNPTPSML